MQTSGSPLEHVLQGQSRARKQPPASTPAAVVERILAIGDAPPEGLRRVPGAQAIQYYLIHSHLQEDQPLDAVLTVYHQFS
jgi:hypothetical protein